MQDADEQVVEDCELRMNHEMGSFTLARLPGTQSNQVISEVEDQWAELDLRRYSNQLPIELHGIS